MKQNWSHLDKFRVLDGFIRSNKGDRFGAFFIPMNGYVLRVIATDGEVDEDHQGSTDWEHVSVSALDTTFNKELTPRWDMMAFIKSQFWNEDEVVVEFHPAKKDYVNIHEHVLHLWRWKKGEFPTPPTICV